MNFEKRNMYNFFKSWILILLSHRQAFLHCLFMSHEELADLPASDASFFLPPFSPLYFKIWKHTYCPLNSNF